jgi:DNA-binding SARP family transcriptional activator/predicted ATPase
MLGFQFLICYNLFKQLLLTLLYENSNEERMLILQHRQIRSKTPLQIGLLGTPEVTFLGQKVSLSRRQGRALLYYLACARRPVSRDKLTFLLFPDDPDSSARRKLTRVLSQLQSQFPGIPLCNTDNSTVLLNPGILWTDVSEFDYLEENNLTHYQARAVEIYRGPFLEGFSLPYSHDYDRWLTEQRQFYENRYLFLLEQLVHHSVESGDHKKGIQYALKYLEVDELAEQIHRSLIELYHDAGNRSAAIRQYETCVVVLERELGVEPLPETRLVYEAVFKGDQHPKMLTKFSPYWSVIPSLDVPLVGREAALRELQNACEWLQKGGMILVHGEAGIGKSRLLQEFTCQQKHLTLTGNCHAASQAIPYVPVVQALRQALAHPELWRGIRPIWLTEIARLLPEMGEIFPDLPLPVEVKPDQAQARLYEGINQCFLGIAANSPLLLCLDDLHWMDEATKGWLVTLSGRLSGSRLCVLGAYRVEEGDAITNMKETFSHCSLLAEISISGLALDAILDVLLQLPQPPPDPQVLAERIKVATGGNPFFILETLRALLESSKLEYLAGELPLAQSVKEAVQQRLARLSPVARQVLEAAAVLTPELKFELLKQTSGRSDGEVSEGLEELVQRQLLIDGEKRLFKHDLLAQAAYQNLTPGRIRLLHRRAAESFRQVYLDSLDEAAAQIAQHYDLAGESVLAVRFYKRAAFVAQLSYAHDEAIAYLTRALKLSPVLTQPPQKLAQLFELLGDSLAAKGELEASRTALNRCLDQIPVEEVLNQVRILSKIGRTFLTQRRINEFDKTFITAQACLGPRSEGREEAWQAAWLDLQLARLETLYFQADIEQLDDLIKEITPVMENAGSPKQWIKFLQGQSYLLSRQDRYCITEKGLKIVEKALQAAYEWGDKVEITYGTFGLGFSYLMSGDLDRAAHVLADCLCMAEEIGVGMTQCQCLTYLAHLHRLRGDIEGTRMYATRSLEIAQKLDVAVYIAAARAQLAWLQWKKGNLTEAEHAARDAVDLWAQLPHPFKWYAYWILCAVQLSQNRIKDAVEAARALLHPSQQRLQDDVTSALERAVECWETGNTPKARTVLKQATELAQERGYL